MGRLERFVNKTLASALVFLLLTGALLVGCSSKNDSTIDLEEQERTRQHKNEFEQSMDS
jgi:hypothetical protein